MGLHRPTRVTMGVPNVADTVAYYTEFGLTPVGGGSFATVDGGEQLRVVHAPRRRLVELGVGADDAADLARVAARMDRLGVPRSVADGVVTAVEPVSGFTARVEVAPGSCRNPSPRRPTTGPVGSTGSGGRPESSATTSPR
jgi:catechol 2,3-dioxygenase-like lactoylglutathione lyase family enzyme